MLGLLSQAEYYPLNICKAFVIAFTPNETVSSEEVINTHIKHNWTLPDSFMIALLLHYVCKYEYREADNRLYCNHIRGCTFGYLRYSKLSLEMKHALVKYNGLSYNVKKLKNSVYTVQYKLDKKIWTKEYKYNLITLLRLKYGN